MACSYGAKVTIENLLKSAPGVAKKSEDIQNLLCFWGQVSQGTAKAYLSDWFRHNGNRNSGFCQIHRSDGSARKDYIYNGIASKDKEELKEVLRMLEKHLAEKKS